MTILLGNEIEDLISSNAEQIFDLKDALAYANGIINTVREPLIVLYPKQIIASVNKSFYKTFKTEAKDTVGKHIYEVGNNQWNIPQLKKLLEEILAKKTSFHDFEVEHNFETIGHKIMLLNARKLNIRNNDGQLILLAIEDITERRRLEKKVAKEKQTLAENKQLRELAKQKDEFFSITSHELKTPVTSIKAFAQLLQEDFADSGNNQAIKMLSRMNIQIDKLTILIIDLLDATRIEAGKFQYKKTWFDFNELAKEMVSEMQFISRMHTFEMQLSKKQDCYGDRDRIGRVITNLLSNAVKYSRNKSKIILKTTKKNGSLILSVQDFGIGIAKSKLRKIFVKFFRVTETADDAFPGLGLGLFISSEIIKRHGGTLIVQSSKGEGSVFSFSLPAHKPANDN